MRVRRRWPPHPLQCTCSSHTVLPFLELSSTWKFVHARWKRWRRWNGAALKGIANPFSRACVCTLSCEEPESTRHRRAGSKRVASALPPPRKTLCRGGRLPTSVAAPSKSPGTQAYVLGEEDGEWAEGICRKKASLRCSLQAGVCLPVSPAWVSPYYFGEKVNATTDISSKEPWTAQNEIETKCSTIRERERRLLALPGVSLCRRLLWALMRMPVLKSPNTAGSSNDHYPRVTGQGNRGTGHPWGLRKQFAVGIHYDETK